MSEWVCACACVCVCVCVCVCMCVYRMVLVQWFSTELGIALKFCSSVAKSLKIKVIKFWGLFAFEENCKGKTGVRGMEQN